MFAERVILILTVHKSGNLREVAIIVMSSGDDAVDEKNLRLARDIYSKVIITDGLSAPDDIAKIRSGLGLALSPLDNTR